jgi:hypothetical protein
MSQGQILPVQVDGIEDHSLLRVDQAGGADADAHQRLPAFLGELVQDLVNKLQRLLAIAVIDRDFNRLFDLSPQVDDSADKFVLRQVQADEIARFRGQAEQDGSLTADGFAVADFFHQAFIDQAGNHVRNSGARQLGEPRNLSAADRFMLKYCLEHKVAVVLLRLLVGGFGR